MTSDEVVRGAVEVSDAVVTFDIERDETSTGKPVWSVLASVYSACPVSGEDLQLQLIDVEGLAISRLAGQDDHGDLTAVSMGRGPAYFKFSDFAHTEVAPAFLSVSLFGRHILEDLVGPEHVVKALFDPSELLLAKAPPPPPPKCCVEEFKAPTGVQANFKSFNRRRTWVTLKPEGWKITAKFKNEGTCDCDRCQYRQELKGTGQIKNPGGKWRPATPPLYFKRVVKKGKIRYEPVHLHPTSFQEDSEPHPDKTQNGVPTQQYGHKPSANPWSEGYSENGCYYWCVDAPHVMLKANPGKQVKMDITFKGKIIDTGTGDPVESKESKWVQNVTL
jgi:hypothetical protein